MNNLSLPLHIFLSDIYAAGKDAIKLLGYEEPPTTEDSSMALTLSSSSSEPAVTTQNLVSYAALEDQKLKRLNGAYDRVPVPDWHAPWKLGAVVSGHLGWVRSIAFDPSNEWFATGSADRTIKVRENIKFIFRIFRSNNLFFFSHFQ